MSSSDGTVFLLKKPSWNRNKISINYTVKMRDLSTDFPQGDKNNCLMLAALALPVRMIGQSVTCYHLPHPRMQ
jgi:hypothetical protein